MLPIDKLVVGAASSREIKCDSLKSLKHSTLLVSKVEKLARSLKLVMPVLDQVQDDGSGIQNILNLLDSVAASLRDRLLPE